MEIERKFLIDPKKLPSNLEQYPKNFLEQAYIITEPVLRIRKKDDTCILTVKGAGLMEREETEFILTEEAYKKLLPKTEGNIITKTRYQIPEKDGLTIELDIFTGLYDGLFIAEVEFPDRDTADRYIPPEWFGKEVTQTSTFHNSTLSRLSPEEIPALLNKG